ncbi:MAG: glycine cleavage system aminomethyltransferase GcvT [Micavibrio aeruginosavorus]|uniref:aminomethyltransferase n=1 Tax=Micavibrio aeruginosavorus TaxID=349221 RepID=A0A7T5UHL2_9BACT|nr:MAG: glycine cleavage system aminomethyltransferase GcvT [Micavibrio aeruginosavorus]
MTATFKTALFDSHIAAGAKIGPFAGYDMPLYYKEGVLKEHEWVRSSAGLFDVSHMGQIYLEGAGVVPFLEKITPSNFAKAGTGVAKYTVMTNESGGIVDDLIITRVNDEKFLSVINAGCKEKDIAWIIDHLPADVKLVRLDDRALIALQGPKAEQVLREVLKIDASGLGYMRMMFIDGLIISRLGYTGEDGFEISVPEDRASDLWVKLLASQLVKPVGLAARDSLRLEMGYPLYGHDINDETTPLEADLGWVMGKGNEGFIGAGNVLGKTLKRKRVGVKLTDKGIAREGAEIRNDKNKVIGALTSGGHSPTLKSSIGMGYVDAAYANPGTKIFVTVRGNNIGAEIAALPFIPARTKSSKKAAA